MADTTESGAEPTKEQKKNSLPKKESMREALALFKFVRPWRWHLVIGMIFLLLSTATVLAFPFALGQIVKAASGGTSEFNTNLNETTLILVGILVLQGIFSFMRIYTFSIVSENSVAEIRKAVFSRILSMPIPWFERHRTGELMSRITSDVQLLHDTLSFTLAEFFRQIATLVVGTGLLFFLSKKLALFALAIYPPLVILAFIFGKFIRKLSRSAQDGLAENNVIVEESLQNVQMVKSYTNESLETGKYSAGMKNVVKLGIKSATARGGFVSFIFLVLLGSIVGVIWYGGKMMLNKELEIGQLFTFVMYMLFVGGSMGGLGEVYGQILKSLGATERLRQILKEEGELEIGKTKTVSHKFKGEIIFDNVGFTYPSRTEIEVLQNISFTIKSGEKVAFAGSSGAGKSTITQLLMGFFKINSGNLLIDGKPIDTYSRHELRGNIGIVPQEVILFGGTIRENIAYGKPNASDKEIEAAAQQANALEFIQNFPEGFETIVGERGIKLSGGQRQRIAIARAILKNPAILLLDEATSSLDSESEFQVQEALDKLMKDRTTIIIAHRLGTIRSADRIYVMDKGKIVEEGSHDELTSKEEGVYSHLVKLQMFD